jgi:hypothetical protein
MGPQEFRDEGFLQEVNRQFFHPLGLAMAVYVNDESLDDCFKVSIWDERDDPEGWFFAEGEIDDVKVQKVDDLKASKWLLRNKLLGHTGPPLEEPIQGINEVVK